LKFAESACFIDTMGSNIPFTLFLEDTVGEKEELQPLKKSKLNNGEPNKRLFDNSSLESVSHFSLLNERFALCQE